MQFDRLVIAGLLGVLAPGQATQAQSFSGPDLGKLIATGGVSQVEGAGGGGLTPWALITGYGTRDSYGANVHLTTLHTADYGLKTAGVAVGMADRFEVSLAIQEFKGSKAPLDQLDLKVDTVGIKLKLAGDAVYDQDRVLPQIAVGAMFKRTHGVGGLGALGVTNVKQLGATSDHGIDYYVAATKIFLDQSLLVNLTLRASKANQFGLLGYGGDQNDRYRPLLEGAVAYLINRRTVAGIEYRMKPHNLSVDKEKDAYDAFVAYFPTKNLSITAAYVALGDITVFNPKRQNGYYLSLQAGF
ncbi:MAG: DUF3034 family protein [Herminiimonas sp.]|nr:DUF3034 family protein [Herminiimonas sp.]